MLNNVIIDLDKFCNFSIIVKVFYVGKKVNEVSIVKCLL